VHAGAHGYGGDAAARDDLELAARVTRRQSAGSARTSARRTSPGARRSTAGSMRSHSPPMRTRTVPSSGASPRCVRVIAPLTASPRGLQRRSLSRSRASSGRAAGLGRRRGNRVHAPIIRRTHREEEA
jgi:hypothetical protein